MRLIFLILGVGLLSCGGEVESLEELERVRGDSRVGGRVVSTVDGHPITLEEVQHAVDATGVTPEVALSRLQDELILARAARRAGFEEDREVRRAVQQATVQALLRRDIEAHHGDEEVDDAELAAFFEQNLTSFERPERRRSVHVLAYVQPGVPPGVDHAAHDFIAEVRDRLAASDDPRAAAFAIQREMPVDRPFEWEVQELDPVTRREDLDQPFLDALFALEAPSVVPQPVRTSYGWHAVVLTEIEPAEETPRAEAIAGLRFNRVSQNRATALGALLTDVANRTDIHLFTETATDYLARPDLLGEAE